MVSKDKKKVGDDPKKKAEPKKMSTKLFLTIGSIIIFVLAGVSFILLPAFTGANASGPGEKLPPFGSYNKQPILYEQNTYFTRMVQQMEQNYSNSGRKLEMFDYYSLFSTAFNASVMQLAYSDEISATGYTVPEAQIDRTIISYFTDENGVYSPKRFNNLPDREKITLRKQIVESLIHDRYFTDLFGSPPSTQTKRYGLKSATAELPFIADMNKIQRRFDIAAFSTANYPQEEIIEFGTANQDLFTLFNLSIITLDTLDAAKKLHNQITGGEVTFADAVTEYSNKSYSSDDGRLTNNRRHQLKTLIKNESDFTAIAELSKDAVSSVIETTSGFSIFRVNETPSAPDFTLEDTVNAVLVYMKAYEAGKIEDYFLAKARDLSAEAVRTNFETACLLAGITKTTTTPFALNYGSNSLLSPVPTMDTGILYGAEKNENFLKTVFSLKEQEISAPLVIGSSILVMKLAEEEITPDEQLALMIPYLYPETINHDQMSIQSHFLKSPKLKNDLTSVFFQYFQ